MKTINKHPKANRLLLVTGLFVMIFSFLKPFSAQSETRDKANNTNTPINVGFSIHQIYQLLSCSEMSFEAFQLALNGYNILKAANQLMVDSLFTVVDFSKPSVENRLFIVDIKNLKVIYKTLVAHGRNSGDLYATKFSNVQESYKSSLGLYVTGNTYKGKHGYSLQLNGMEKGINNNALSRAIVMHGADYVCKEYIQKYGRIGRSLGCPAVSNEESAKIINYIKNGSCLFLYHPSYTSSNDLALR
jgi:hypothetical protein